MTRRAAATRHLVVARGARGAPIAGQQAQRGFTLIEVLVAVALMAIVSVMAWRGLDSVIRIRDHVQRDADRDDALLRVLGQLQLDVRMRAPDAVLDGGVEWEGTLPASVRLDAGRNGPAVDIVRGPAPAGRWWRVRWWRDGDVLRRATGAGSDVFPLPQPGAGADVLDGVAAFGVEAWIPGRGWIALPAASGAETATALAFVLRLAGSSPESTRVYRRVVVLQ
jgi:general secretion pathway protein J